MDELKNGESLNLDEEKLVHDYSVDHKGKVPFRASTGVWKASLFIISKHQFNISASFYLILMWIFKTNVKVTNISTKLRSRKWLALPCSY